MTDQGSEGTDLEAQSIAARLCANGYLPAEVPPLIQTIEFADHLAASSFEILDLHDGQPSWTRTRPERFSAARLNGLRRVLGVVNPHSFARLAVEIEASWQELTTHYDSAAFSVSRPVLAGTKRALTGDDPFGLRDLRRREAAVTSSFRLRTDVAQCYPSMYTHAIPWALHGRPTAKAHQNAEEQIAGGRLDRRARDMVDGQTSGLPIGPDTSLALAEVVLSRIDHDSGVTSISSFQGGVRNIDDYELFFSARSGADEALEKLERAAAELELALNPHKTTVEQAPLEIEDRWKSRVTASLSSSKSLGSTTGFLNEMLALAREFPGDAVVPYGIKVALGNVEAGSDAHRAVIDVALAATHFSAASMKHTLPIAAEAVSEGAYPATKLAHALNLVVERAANLHRHDELSWALWSLAATGQRLVTEASEAMRSSTDSMAVALYHYMREVGLADGEDAPELASISTGDLMTESWLLAYEAIRRGWTSGISLAQSPFFERLADDGVTFLPPTDFDEPDAISDWLDDHPPITGTVSGY